MIEVSLTKPFRGVVALLAKSEVFKKSHMNNQVFVAFSLCSDFPLEFLLFFCIYIYVYIHTHTLSSTYYSRNYKCLLSPVNIQVCSCAT